MRRTKAVVVPRNIKPRFERVWVLAASCSAEGKTVADSFADSFTDSLVIRENCWMKALTALCSFLLMIASVCAAESEQRVGDFSLFDQRGDLHQMSRYKNRKGVVLLTSSSECPMSSKIATNYSKIKTNLLDLGFEFMVLDFGRSTDRDRMSREISQRDLGLPVLMDENQLVSESLGVRKTNEVLVFDPKSFRVIYRGSADRNLEAALFSILAGEEVMNSISNASGCEINKIIPENN